MIPLTIQFKTFVTLALLNSPYHIFSNSSLPPSILILGKLDGPALLELRQLVVLKLPANEFVVGIDPGK